MGGCRRKITLLCFIINFSERTVKSLATRCHRVAFIDFAFRSASVETLPASTSRGAVGVSRRFLALTRFLTRNPKQKGKLKWYTKYFSELNDYI
jgi:hypothetical protein